MTLVTAATTTAIRVQNVRQQARNLAAKCEAGVGAPTRQQISQLQACVAEYIDSFDAVCHPLGFLCLELFRDATRSVRLHLWCRVPEGPEIVHSHDFDMSSVVVAGSLINSVYELAAGAGVIPLLDIEYTDAGEVLKPSGAQVGCRCVASQTLYPCQTYRVRAGQFHSVRPRGRLPAATFVSTRRVASCIGQVLAYAGMNEATAARSSCSREEKLAALHLLMEGAPDFVAGPSLPARGRA